MNIVNESGYLYSLSKKLIAINKEIHSRREEIHKLTEQYSVGYPSERQQKVQRQYRIVAEKIRKAVEERQHLLTQLHRHQVAFAGGVQKESKV